VKLFVPLFWRNQQLVSILLSVDNINDNFCTNYTSGFRICSGLGTLVSSVGCSDGCHSCFPVDGWWEGVGYGGPNIVVFTQWKSTGWEVSVHYYDNPFPYQPHLILGCLPCFRYQ
jgi:hypothetical protein